MLARHGRIQPLRRGPEAHLRKDRKGSPELFVLDSTDPAQISALESQFDLAKTIFIVSSKSGSTLEPNIFKQYFFDTREAASLAAAEAGKHFIAITDPGSKMQQVAERDGFRHIFFGLPSIGGRYSALSNFGMIPGAIQGIDVAKFLDRAEEMVACVRFRRSLLTKIQASFSGRSSARCRKRAATR